jgi:hypothetical protein
MNRPTKLVAAAAALVLFAGTLAACTNRAQSGGADAALPVVTVYRSATCGCCGKWAEHMKQAGFTVKTVDVTDVAATKRQYGVPGDLSSCHTAVVGDYVVEGHVPADVVKQMLQERPAIAGIAVPGMPIGSPGMEQGGRKDRYDVVALGRAGERYTYARR